MLFGKRKKKQGYDEKMEELEVAMLTEKDLKNARKIEQYVVEHLEQTIELAKEIDEEKEEYRMVNSYLNDIQTLENLPRDKRRKIEEIAVNVVQLNTARTEFLNSAKKLSDAQFAQLEQREEEVPAAIKRLMANEAYRDTLQKDMKYLEREKSEWVLRREYLTHQVKFLKNLLYIMVGIAATTAVLFIIMQLVLEVDMFYAWMGWVFVTAVVICVIFLRMQSDRDEIAAAERCRNRAVLLSNKVKIKYVNIANAVDYACEKYHVQNGTQLGQQWEYYLEAVKEREKYERTNDDLEYFKGRLVRELAQYKFYDSQVWVSQAAALVNPKEMVEVKHALINRRQKLRLRMEYNAEVIKKQKMEAEQMLDRVGDMRPQVEKILSAIDRLSENFS